MSRGGDGYQDELTKQRYLEESFNKERDTRLKFYFNSNRSKEDGADTRASKQYEVLIRKLQAAGPKPTEELMRLRRDKQSTREDDGVQLPKISATSDLNLENTESWISHSKPRESITLPPIGDMNEVDKYTRSKIYDGKGADGKGRRTYLNLRNNVRPETKYNYPILSSWEYGWRLGDVIKIEDLKNPEFGRSRIVADTFYRNNLDRFTHRA